MIKNDLENEIHSRFVDWRDSLKKGPYMVQIWREAFKRGINFKADADIRCPKCGETEPVFCCENCGHTFPHT